MISQSTSQGQTVTVTVFLLSLIYKTEQRSSILECPVLENSHVNCQAQSKPQLQLSWTEMVLISQLTGTTHPPTTQDSSWKL